MHALLVVSHPDPASFTHAIATAFAAGVTASGEHTTEVADLAAEGFQPAFGAADRAAYLLQQPLPHDIPREHARLERADALVLVYPVYWWSFPGQLKGWIDRVFTNGWAYDEAPDGTLGKRLGHLPVHLLGIGGADAGTYARRGYDQAIRTQIDHGIFDFCGAPVVTSQLLSGVNGGDTAALLETARELGRTAFARAAARVGGRRAPAPRARAGAARGCGTRAAGAPAVTIPGSPHSSAPRMDSLSQLALGAAVGVAVMGRRTAVWKSALWGGVAGTLPDLDVFVRHGNPIHDMVLHRAESHALLWLTLFSLPFGAAIARLHGEWPQWRRWWAAMWLALVTHPLLDTMTVYGTQLLLPFTDHPFAVGSVFIIDPLYTVPLLAGAVWALVTKGSRRGHVANAAGLALSTAYLAWGVAAQQHVTGIARASLAQQGIVAERVLVTPTPFNTLLWRVVAMSGDHYHEGFHALLDDTPQVTFDAFPRGNALWAQTRHIDGVQRIAAFSHGFFSLHEADGRVLISDLRMGQEPHYSFTFAVAERQSPPVPLDVPETVRTTPDLDRALPWLWRRMGGEPVPSPR